jgi:transposase
MGMSAETLRRWVRDADIERGECDGVTVAEQAEIRDLRRQIRGLERRS